jgi:glycerol-3-phosphate acyltransferase PlsY
VLELSVKILLGYLMGALNGSLLIGKFTGVDIRKDGSGNAGGTNALRTQGAWFALGVMIIDVGKGFLPAWWLPAVTLPGVPLDPDISRTWLMLACGSAAVIGHCYPVWFEFSGGKGMATAVGMLIAVAPGLLLPGALVFAGVLTVTGWVGLSSMLSVTSLPLMLWWLGEPGNGPEILTLALLALFIVYTHRSNIERMLNGRESRIGRVMLFRSRAARNDEQD